MSHSLRRHRQSPPALPLPDERTVAPVVRVVVAIAVVIAGVMGCGPNAVAVRGVDIDRGDGGGSDGLSADVAAEGEREVGEGPGGGGAAGGGFGGRGGGGGAAGGTDGAGGRGGASGRVDAMPDMVMLPDVGGPLDTRPDVAEDVAPVPRRVALLVVGDLAAITAGDLKLRSIAAANGFDLVVVDDASPLVMVNDLSVILIASSTTPASIAGRYQAAPRPVIVFESGLFDDMSLTASADTARGETATRDVLIEAANAAHPLSAGLTGQVAVNMGGPPGCCVVNWGVPAAAATRIAYWGATANPRVATFAYEAGAMMAGNFVAPAKRVGIFASDETLGTMTTPGVQLVAAALLWAATP